METDNTAPTYRVWGADEVAYGPVELPGLIAWIKDDRVTSHTWVFVASDQQWIRACELPELRLVFESKAKATAHAGSPKAGGIKPGPLRRLKIFGSMEERQLESFVHYMEVVHCRQFSLVVRAGEPGDAMFLILEGELRARVLVNGKETTLATMTTGDFFGEISLLDEGPRSADVVANRDSVLLKISTAAFNRMLAEAPGLATPFLFNLSRSVVARVRALTKKYQDSIHFWRTASGPS